jgi:beta-glucosidase
MKAILAVAVSGLLVGAAGANLAVNGSFEDGPEGVFAATPARDVLPGWRLFDTTDPDAVKYELVEDAAEATDGNHYVKITSTATSAGPDAGLDITMNGAGAVAATIGTGYTVSFDAKRVAGTNNNLAVSIRTCAGDTVVEHLVEHNLSLTSEWTAVSYEVAPAKRPWKGAAPVFYIGFRPKFKGALLDETIYIDNVSIEEISADTKPVNGRFKVTFADGTAREGSCSPARPVVEPSFVQQLFSAGRPAVRAVSASSPGDGFAAAADGDLSTHWTSGPESTAWVTLELEEQTVVRSVAVFWDVKAAKAGDVQVSLDGSNWETVGEFERQVDETVLFVSCRPTTARFVRLRCLKRHPRGGGMPGHYTIWDVAVNPEMKPFLADWKDPVRRTFADREAGRRAEAMLAGMTADQKIDYIGQVLADGAREELGLPKLRVTDASMGVKDPPNTAFPSTILLAATWNPERAALQGKSIAQACRHKGINCLLGPGMNIYRTSINGRNFEYMGEDPYLVSRMAVAYVKAVQQQGVMATVKHFAVNNIELSRRENDSQVGERALREIYFPAFKATVQEGGAHAVMTAYNLLNGRYCAENPWLIKEVLEGDWGYTGIVMSDWRSTSDPVMTFNSGIDAEMPWGRAMNRSIINELLQSEIISAAELDDKVKTILYNGYASGAFDYSGPDASFPAGTREHAAAAETIAEEGIILLKNRNGLLPLDAATGGKIILAGPMVENAPPSGRGSGDVRYAKGKQPPSIRSAFEKRFGTDRLVVCGTEERCRALRDEDLAAADAVIVCVGFNQEGFGESVYEGEGADRPFGLSEPQQKFVERCVAKNPRTVVAVTAGGGMDMEGWDGQAGAILYTWYTGEAGGTPLAKIVCGEVNPSGRLPISIERSWSDSPVAASPVKTDVAHVMHGRSLVDTPYSEGILVGYRYYDTKQLPVRYAFGHGLSYTTFDYSDLRVVKSGEGDRLDVAVSVTVKNTGSRSGRETVQVYVHDREASVLRPVRELKGFSGLDLKPGEAREVTVHLDRHAFEFFDPDQKRWVLEPGEFEIQVGKSSRDIQLVDRVLL